MNSEFSEWLKRPVGVSRSVNGENVTGEPGKGGMADPAAKKQTEVEAFGQISDLDDPHPARDLGPKYKIRPWIYLAPGVETPLLNVDGPGMIRHIWFASMEERNRSIIIRMYWDDEKEPSVECPLGDFFCCAPKFYAEMQSAVVCVNPKNGLNCYFPMPFRKHARVTVENRTKERLGFFFYTIDYTLEPVPEDTPYLHCSFRRVHTLTYGDDIVIADGIKGEGTFAGCYLAWQQNNSGWWGEGEVKMFIDGDKEYPTICGTGTEDYFCGAWGFDDKFFASLYSGYTCGGKTDTGTRHGMYRFRIKDPIWFHQDLKVTMQALGWRQGNRYLPLRDDVASTAWWYQFEPHAPLPQLGSQDDLENI